MSTQSSAGLFEVPRVVKIIGEWWKSISAIGLLFGSIATYFAGSAGGWIVSFLVAVLYVLFVLTFRLLIREGQTSLNAVAALDRPERPPAEVRHKATDDLRSSTSRFIYAIATLATLFVVSSVCVSFLAYPIILRRCFAEKPKVIEFQSLPYFMAGDQQELLEKAPFMEAVVSSLREEGQAHGKKFRIVLGRTKAFTNPTQAFRCTMKMTDGEYDLTGYAFRRHSQHQEGYYEPVQASYPKDNPVVFDIPPCEIGDELFVIVRVTLMEGDQFPSDPAKVTTLQTIN